MEEIKSCSLKFTQKINSDVLSTGLLTSQSLILTTLWQVGNFFNYNELYFVNFLSFEEERSGFFLLVPLLY